MSYTDNAGAEWGMAWRGEGGKQGRGDNRHREKGQRKMGKREGKRERRREKKRKKERRGREKEREKERGEERARGVIDEVQMGNKSWEMRYGRGERGEGSIDIGDIV